MLCVADRYGVEVHYCKVTVLSEVEVVGLGGVRRPAYGVIGVDWEVIKSLTSVA